MHSGNYFWGPLKYLVYCEYLNIYQMSNVSFNIKKVNIYQMSHVSFNIKKIRNQLMNAAVSLVFCLVFFVC